MALLLFATALVVVATLVVATLVVASLVVAACWFCSFCVAQSDLFFRFSNWLRLSLAVTIAPSWNRNRSHRHCELLTTSQQQQWQRQQMKLKLKKSAHIPVQKMCNAIKSIASGLKAQLTDFGLRRATSRWAHLVVVVVATTSIAASHLGLTSSECTLATALCTAPPTLLTPVYIHIVYIYRIYIWQSWSSIRRLSTAFHSLFHTQLP